MRVGDLWRNADAASTTNEVLFSSNSHFRVTTGVLNGEWKEKGLEHPLAWESFSAWWEVKEHFKKIAPWSMK